MLDAGLLATFFLIAGLILLALEFFIPSFGMILVMAVISLVISFWSATKAWWGTSPGFFWTYVGVLTLGIPGSLFGTIALIQRTSLGNRIILQPAHSLQVSGADSMGHYVGQRGRSLSLMTPGGMVLIGGERLHGESVGMVIEPNVDVVVVAIRGNRVTVRPADSMDQSPEPIASPQVSTPQEASRENIAVHGNSDTTAAPDRLDFEVPEDYSSRNGSAG